MRLNRSAVAACVVAFLLAGCCDVEVSVTLERDLSGQAAIDVTLDHEAMIVPTLRMMRETGEPTPEEIAAARQRALESQGQRRFARAAEQATAEAERTMPPGVRLLEGKVDERDLKVLYHYRFGFDDVRKLQRIGGPPEGAPEPKAIDLNLQRRPFGSFQLADEGKTLLLSTLLPNPLGAPPSPGETPAAKQAREAMADLFQFHFRLITAFEVIDSNATRRDGKALVWDYDRAAFAKLDPGKTIRIWARLRR